MSTMGREWEDLHSALLNAFPGYSELAHMVRSQLDVNLSLIASGPTLSQTVRQLLHWAEAHGQTEPLLRGALVASPGDPCLQALADRLPDQAARSPSSGTHDTFEPSRDLGELRDVLAWLYPSAMDIPCVVQAAGLAGPQLSFRGATAGIWQQVLEEAIRSGQLARLLRSALADYPKNQQLSSLYQAVERAAQPERSSDPVNREELLHHLGRLLPAQLVEVLFRLGLHLDLPSITSQADRAAEIVHRVESDRGREGLADLHAAVLSVHGRVGAKGA